MITYKLTISSKNIHAINLFLLFCFNNSKPKINSKIYYYSKKVKKKIITILKSPHVNKIAQEQFEYRIVSKQISLSSFNNIKYLILLKKIKEKLFPEIKIKIKFKISKKKKL